MNNGPLLFLGIFATLATSFWGLILAPQLQFGRQQPRLIEATGEFYPPQRPGLAEQGADVYRSLGCVECHSQQVRQTGVHFDVWVTELTTNMSVVAPAVARLQPKLAEADASKLLAQLPARISSGLPVNQAQALAKQLTDAGAKAESALVVLGSDIQRGWGRRMSVAQDYLREYPVQLGNLRLGPDLASYGSRQTNRNLILLHLYEPERTMPKSTMPPYRFLFERRSVRQGEALPEHAIVLTQPQANKAGEIAVPKPEALALTEYLTSLRVETPLYEAPVGNIPGAQPPAPAANTNAPGATANPGQ